MKKDSLLLLPFFVQSIAMAVDEFYFHLKRGLPRWERLGHPLDTLTVVLCYLFLVLVPPSTGSSSIFIGMAVFSSFFVTKDEFIHSKLCSPLECWLHSCLFVLHPVCLYSAGKLWWVGEAQILLEAQLVILCVFGTYQTIYWNFYGKKHADYSIGKQ